MSGILFHNVHPRSLGIVLVLEMSFFVQMIRNRKPGVFLFSAAFDLDSLTEPGLGAIRRCDVALAIIVVWVIVVLVLGAVIASGLVG